MSGKPWITPENCPAFPYSLENHGATPITGPDGGEIAPGFLSSWSGLSAREHAALQLRVPTSGTAWLDEMIRQARALDAGEARGPSEDLHSGGGSEGVIDLTAHPVGKVSIHTGTKPASPIKTMGVDGVLYKEAEEEVDGLGSCSGCAFFGGDNDQLCQTARRAGLSTFGGDCGQRDVIYLKA